MPYIHDINEKSLRLYFWNVHDITSYLDILELIEQFSSSFNIIGISETFFSSNQSQSLSLYSFLGFYLRVKNRVVMSHGRVRSLVKNGLKYNKMNDLSIWIEGKFEVFSIEIELDGRKI